MSAACTKSPSAYALTADAIVKLLTRRLGAGTAEPTVQSTTSLNLVPVRPEHGVAAHFDFAPRGLPSAGKALRRVLIPPVAVAFASHGGVTGLLDGFSRVIGAKPKASDDTKFIEQFRYILAASQLLDDTSSQAPWHIDPDANKAVAPSAVDSADTLLNNSAFTLHNHAIATGIAALTLVWLVYWSRWKLRAHSLTKKKVVVIIVMVAVVLVGVYAYTRRQLLLHLRREALTTAVALVANFRSIDASTANALQHIQEVELVGRGYRLSMPMPPISRIEQGTQSRRCVRLRKILGTTYSRVLPALIDNANELKRIVDEDDLERYMDVYEMDMDDVSEATCSWRDDEFDDRDSIQVLRVFQLRVTTLRRLLLCSLISLDADGTSFDYHRWHVAGEVMRKLASIAAHHARRINDVLLEDDDATTQTLMSPVAADSPASVSCRSSVVTAATVTTRERLRKQFRSLATLSTGIRSIQAKMQILREDSRSILADRSSHSRSIDTSEEGLVEEDLQLAELGNSLLAHYDTIGTDLKSLIHVWESGRTGLALSLDRAERRISRASAVSSSGPRSPALSLGGLTAVDELLVGGTPLDALAALEGISPTAPDRSRIESKGRLSPRLRISTSTELSDSAADSASFSASTPSSGMDEVYEGVAAPRLPKILGTPQERAQRLLDERRRRESRQVGAQMIRELESVLTSSARAAGDIGPRANRRSSVLASPVATAASRGAPPLDGQGRIGGLSAAAGLNRSNSLTQQAGNFGKRRPFSMYNIAPPTSSGQQRMPSI